jgi:hypothetical protein
MTFSEGVLRLVRGSFWQPESDLEPETDLQVIEASPIEAEPGLFASDIAASAEAIDPAEATVPDALDAEQPSHEPGFSDIEAAVALVNAGLARRVVLSNFPSWPGLLWRAYQLAEETDVTVMPTVVRPGGRVDIVVAKEIAND